jgi:molybdopterin molybdotransferase
MTHTAPERYLGASFLDQGIGQSAGASARTDTFWMLDVETARERILSGFEPLPSVPVNVSDALGLVLAGDLEAPHDLPRFDNSAMDGYAVRADDAEQASEGHPVTLRLAGEVAAGGSSDREVEPGTAVRIMTGAPMPPGADAIVPVEVTEESGDEVQILEAPVRRRFVRPAGEDVRTGDTVVSAGTELGPGELALLASLGLSPVQVHPKPRVGIVVTGNELVAPEKEPGPGEIRDSNSVALRSLVLAAGGEPTSYGPVGDDLESTENILRAAAEDSDLVISSGGVSMGRYDFVRTAIENSGAIDFWRVAMQPGKPVVSGRIGDTPFLGLPGNPVSIHIGFEQFVRPVIQKLRGNKKLTRPRVPGTLTEPINKRPGRLHFVRVRLEWNAGRLSATPTGAQGSHMQSSLVECDGVVLFPLEAAEIKAGDEVQIEVWRLPS